MFYFMSVHIEVIIIRADGKREGKAPLHNVIIIIIIIIINYYY